MAIQAGVERTPTVMDILPTNIEVEIAKAKQARIALDKLFQELLVPGVDFDRVPGTDKPTLLKPGAELLCQVFHLAPGKAEMVAREENFETGVLSYTIGVPIFHRESGILIAYGIGAANSKEPKYRYRYNHSGDEEIKIENPDPGGQQNTLVKMAAKRALVDGVLKATGASRVFTQDVEDLLPPEPASSKQKNYLRVLMKGKNEGAVLREHFGEGISSIDDLTREQARTLIEALKDEHEPKSNGQTEGERARKAVFAALHEWADKMGFSRDEVTEVAKEILRKAYKVDSCSKLTEAQWIQIARSREKLVKRVEAHFASAATGQEVPDVPDGGQGEG